MGGVGAFSRLSGKRTAVWLGGALGIAGGLSIALSGLARADPGANAGAGAPLYKNNCTACHGDAGNGRGPAATALSPSPPDFTSPAFWADKTDSYLLHVITNGLGPMPGWGETLSPVDIQNLLDYVKTFRKG
ncbi:MAG: c-type cytochrome [Leptospirillia bacterium]